MVDMKVAVIGTGKTGSEVLKLLNDDKIVGPFDTSNPPTIDKLRPADAAVIFVPGTAVDDILEPVMAAGLVAAWGSTGYDWHDDELDKKLKEKNMKWMRASNFSLGMNIVRRCLNIIGRGAGMLDKPTFNIHEIHHTGKQDAPSGTALSWQAWLDQSAKITSERKGDIKGIHRLEMQTAVESLQLKHEVHDRAVFAAGALWSVRRLASDDFAPGFYTMQTLFDQSMR